jgi:hypothetical protein
MNNSFSKATLRLKWPDGRVEELQTDSGAVLEMVGLAEMKTAST